jgi:hypothetical protein
VVRDAARDLPRDIARDVTKDSARDIVKDSTRDVARDLPRVDGADRGRRTVQAAAAAAAAAATGTATARLSETPAATQIVVPVQLPGASTPVTLRPTERSLPLASFERGAPSQRQLAQSLSGAVILETAARAAPMIAEMAGGPAPRARPRVRPVRLARSYDPTGPLVVMMPERASITDEVILREAVLAYLQLIAR